MTKVSRLPLRNDIWERIFDLFLKTTISIKDKKKLQGFMNDLYSPTEKIMLAKRLACAVMIAKGNNYQSIRRTLRISPPTIAKMSMLVKYKGQGLTPILEEILKRDAFKIIWKELASIVDLPGKGNDWVAHGKRKFRRRLEISELKSEF